VRPVRMFFDQYDKDAMRLIMDAQSEARGNGRDAMSTEYILLAATLGGGEVQDSLRRGGLESGQVKDYLQQMSGGSRIPRLDALFSSAAKDELLPFGPDSERALRGALNYVSGDNLVSARELIISVLADDGDSGAKQMLTSLSVNSGSLQKEVESGPLELVGAGQGKRKNSTLAQCSVDLTAMAREGKLDPVIGREDEVRRCMQILVRRRKSNPVLIGDPGVGKTAIAEGLAQRMVDGNVPPRLKGKSLISLELGMLVADTKYRGQFEERLKSVLEEVTANNDTVLFIDELHTLVGAGAAEGAIDAANLLKPALARGDLSCIGATTVAEYRKYIEKDAALERRFQSVSVPEPSIEQTASILQGLAPKYEEHHQVTYTDKAIWSAAKLAERYISDRFLPDKAIDLLDEAGAVRQMRAFEASMYDPQAPPPSMEVTEDDVASVVAQWTTIPVSKLTQDEAQSMTGLEAQLHERVIGQHGAVTAISRALRRARVGLRDPTRPIAGMIFSGPTGVGKTELAKAVAGAYYGSEKAMVRFDMSEYMESFSASRLTGPPPGYVGYEEGGQLTEAVRRSPHCLILMDEVEKAHPDVFNLLLQVLEDGRLTDNKGRLIDFSNSMLILTSNVGSRAILDLAQRSEAASFADDAGYARMRGAVKRELGTKFRPEFLNRLDEIIVFSALEKMEVSQVAELMLQQLVGRCREQELELTYGAALKELIVQEGFSRSYGARPLRRAIQRLCEDSVAEAVLEGFVLPGEAFTLDADTDGSVLLYNVRGETRVTPQRAGQGIEDDDDATRDASPGSGAAVGVESMLNARGGRAAPGAERLNTK